MLLPFGSPPDTKKLKVSTNDTTPGFLNGKLVAGSNVTLTENNDGGNETLTVAVPGLVTDHGGLTGLSDDDHTQYHTDARALTWLGTRSTADLPEGSNLYFTNERVDDRVNALLVAGSNITLTYDDTANTLTVASSGGGGVTDHGALTGLSDDDHTQYALLAGRSGGQTIIGGTGTTDDLILRTTSGVGATGADMIFQIGNNGATEAMRILNSGRFGIGITGPGSKFHVKATANEIQAIVQGHGSQSVSLQEWQLSDGTVAAQVSKDGWLRVGSGGSAAVPVQVSTSAGNSTLGGLLVSYVTAYTGGSTHVAASYALQIIDSATSGYTGLSGQVKTGGSGAFNASAMTGFVGDVLVQGASGTIASAVGGSMRISCTNGTNITDAAGLRVYSAIRSGAGTIGTNYGLKIDDQTAGTTNYSIHAGSAQSYFAGKVGLGVTTPLAVLHLKAGTATANTGPLKFTSGTDLTTAEAGVVEYGGRFTVTESDTTRRFIVQAASSSKTAGTPIPDGYVEVVINGSTIKLMTTA